LISASGKQERGAPMSATSNWVEGTQRAMKEELVDQAVADQLKRSKQSLSFLAHVADEGLFGIAGFGDPFDDSFLKKHA